jgi:hypothetical protein
MECQMNLQERIDNLNAMAADIVAQLTELSTLEEQVEMLAPPHLVTKRDLLESSTFVDPTH